MNTVLSLMRWPALLLALAIALPAAAQPAPRPNIVYIVADDQGWKDAGFRGSDIATPTLDRLAEGGARLEAFYAQPMCTPSRAALMSGRYPHRYGLQTLVIPSNGRYGLATDEKLLPAVLRDAGYRTAIVGKWHLGHADRKYWPLQRGFQHQYGPLLGEIDYFTHDAHGVRDWYRQERPLNEKGYATELIGNEAVRWLRNPDRAAATALVASACAGGGSRPLASQPLGDGQEQLHHGRRLTQSRDLQPTAT